MKRITSGARYARQIGKLSHVLSARRWLGEHLSATQETPKGGGAAATYARASNHRARHGIGRWAQGFVPCLGWPMSNHWATETSTFACHGGLARVSAFRAVWRGVRGHARGDKVDPAKRTHGIACAYVSETISPWSHAKCAHCPLCVCPSRAASSPSPVMVTRNGYLTAAHPVSQDLPYTKHDWHAVLRQKEVPACPERTGN